MLQQSCVKKDGKQVRLKISHQISPIKEVTADYLPDTSQMILEKIMAGRETVHKGMTIKPMNDWVGGWMRWTSTD